MRNRAKYLTSVILFAVFCLLSACRSNRPPTADVATKSAEHQDQTNSRQTGEDSKDADIPTESTEEDADQNFNRFSPQMCCSGGSLYFFEHLMSGNRFLKVYEPESDVSFPVCGKAECTHNNAECNSWLNEGSNSIGLTRYQGKIYWINFLFRENAYVLWRMDRDGTHHEFVRKLGSGTGEDAPPTGNVYIQIHRGVLYVAGYNADITDGVHSLHLLVKAYDLDSDKEETLFDYDAGTENTGGILMQCFREKVYILALDVKMTGEGFALTEDGRYQSKIMILTYDIASGRMDTVFDEMGLGYAPSEIIADEDGLAMLAYKTPDGICRSLLYWKQGGAKLEEIRDLGDMEGRLVSLGEGKLISYSGKDLSQINIDVYDLEGKLLAENSYRIDDGLKVSTIYYVGCDADNLYYEYSYGDTASGKLAVAAYPLSGASAKLIYVEE